MKVLLLKDVYKLGRAGDVKRVADGYGRNYLLPQKLAVLATAEAMNMSERVREKANVQRAIVNKEMDSIAKRLEGVTLVFPARASETGKLYGSISTQMIVDALKQKTDVDVARRQVDTQPIRTLGEYKVHVRLTVDLIPTIDVIVHREGEAVSLPNEPVAEPAQPEAEAVVENPVEPAAAA
ncbi:MAG TPA: 50S ribosomal protein L9 [Anaerolineales bacterium]|nr:50S ribosomal protein L9 [Anaerolineales bacterium]